MKPNAVEEAALVSNNWFEDVLEEFAAQRIGLVEYNAVGIGKALSEYSVDGFPARWPLSEILPFKFPANVVASPPAKRTYHLLIRPDI